MIKHFSSQVIPMDKHVIHIFFKSFGHSLYGWKREIACNAASICAFAIVFSAELFASYVLTGDDPGGFPLSQSILFMVGAAVLLGISVRLTTVLFNRLRKPFDWLISPLPLWISCVAWLYFYVYAIKLHRVLHHKTAMGVESAFDIVWPMIFVLFTLMLFSNYFRASTIKQKEILAANALA